MLRGAMQVGLLTWSVMGVQDVSDAMRVGLPSWYIQKRGLNMTSNLLEEGVKISRSESTSKWKSGISKAKTDPWSGQSWVGIRVAYHQSCGVRETWRLVVWCWRYGSALLNRNYLADHNAGIRIVARGAIEARCSFSQNEWLLVRECPRS